MENPLIRQNDRYQGLEVLGEGGMGVVYRAYDALMARNVAIKSLKQEYAQDKDLLARFRLEAKSIASLQHKNIVTAFTLEMFEGVPYLIMEYLEGRSMAEMIASHQPVPLVDKIGLMCQVCEGLQYAHEHKVVHRDIKPANILILNDKDAKIIDFGIARASMSESLTQTGQVIGSVYYMSPEQFNGAIPDPRTDVYSAGVTLFQFLTGELPFKGNDPNSTIAKLLNDAVPPLGKYLSDYPPELDQIIEKATAKTAEGRYQSAEDFGYDLSQLQERLKRGMTAEYLAQAKMAIDRKDWETARRQLQEVIRFDKRNPEATDLFKKVQDEFQRQQTSVQIGKLKSEAQRAIAERKYDEALEYVDQALRLDQEDVELAAIASSIRDRIERAREFSEALRQGYAALYSGSLSEADQAVEKAIQIDPDHTEARTLANQIKKELAERERAAEYERLLEQARREISTLNFVSALHALTRAKEINPGDPTIRGLINLAVKGHEQEKLRKKLEEVTDTIGQLVGASRPQEALESCNAALKEFPDNQTLINLHQLAKRQCEILERHRAVEETSAAAQRLMDMDRHDEASRLLVEVLRSYPDEPNMETLLAIAQAECERSERAKDDLQKQQQMAQQSSAINENLTRKKTLELLNSFQDGLDRQLPFSQLRSLAECASGAATDPQLSPRFSALSAELESRLVLWGRDCQELEHLDRSIRGAKQNADAESYHDRARAIAERYGRDEEIRGRYAKIRQVSDKLKLQREAVCKQLSDLLNSMQGRQSAAHLAEIQEQMREVSAFWLEDAFVLRLVGQASAYIEEARQRKENLLQELSQLTQLLSAARSGGQIRLLGEQAKMLAVDSEDADVSMAVGTFVSLAEAKFQRLDRTVSQLRDLSAKIAAAQTMADVEAYAATAREVVSDESEAEEISDSLRRIQHSVEERKKEYGRICTNLERLVESSTQASGQAELDLILARSRDFLKRYPEDRYFSDLEASLEMAVSERREYLAAIPVEALDSIPDVDLDTIEVPVEPAPRPSMAEPLGVVSPPVVQSRARSRFARVAIAGAVFACLIAVTAFVVMPKKTIIQTDPLEARISVDGKPCKNPCTLTLRSGSHQLQAEQDGYVPLTTTITVPWLRGTFQTYRLVPPPPPPLIATGADAKVIVKASSPDVLVFLDGVPEGATKSDGTLELAAKPGNHKIRVEKAGYSPAPQQVVRFTRGTEPTVMFDVVPKVVPPGVENNAKMIVVTSAPDALVYLDGTPEGTTGVGGRLELATTPGPHQVRVEKAGFLPVDPKDVEFTKNSEPTVPFTLATKPSPPPPPSSEKTSIHVAVKNAPPGAEVHVDQEFAGHAAADGLLVTVQPGSHTVEVFSPNYESLKQVVTANAGKTTEMVATLTPNTVTPNPVAHLATLPSKPGGLKDIDRNQIQDVLNQYAQAAAHGNINKLKEYWPTIPKNEQTALRNLSKDHKDVGVQLTIENASPVPGSDTTAVVNCSQVLTYDGQPHDAKVTFLFGRFKSGWIINEIPPSN